MQCDAMRHNTAQCNTVQYNLMTRTGDALKYQCWTEQKDGVYFSILDKSNQIKSINFLSISTVYSVSLSKRHKEMIILKDWNRCFLCLSLLELSPPWFHDAYWDLQVLSGCTSHTLDFKRNRNRFSVALLVASWPKESNRAFPEMWNWDRCHRFLHRAVDYYHVT